MAMMTASCSQLLLEKSKKRTTAQHFWGGCGSGGREGRLLIARLAVRSPTPLRPCAEASLSKILNTKFLPMGTPAPCMAAPPPSVSVSMNGWVWVWMGEWEANCEALWVQLRQKTHYGNAVHLPFTFSKTIDKKFIVLTSSSRQDARSVKMILFVHPVDTYCTEL